MYSDDLIKRLNDQIAKIDVDEINEQIKNNKLERWLQLWKLQTGAVCFGLYEHMHELEKNLTWDDLKEIVLNIPSHEAETEFVKGLILGASIKKMEEKKNEN